MKTYETFLLEKSFDDNSYFDTKDKKIDINRISDYWFINFIGFYALAGSLTKDEKGIHFKNYFSSLY